jgi:hypothetical protein
MLQLARINLRTPFACATQACARKYAQQHTRNEPLSKLVTPNVQVSAPSFKRWRSCAGLMQLLWLLLTAALCNSAALVHQSTQVSLPEPARGISHFARCLRGGSTTLVAKPDAIASVRVQRTPEWLRRLGIPFTQVLAATRTFVEPKVNAGLLNC